MTPDKESFQEKCHSPIWGVVFFFFFFGPGGGGVPEAAFFC